MTALRLFVVPAFLLLAGVGAAQSEERKVVVPGEPPLTQDMVDDYAKLVEWRLGPAVAKAGGTDRLRQMIVNDWKNGDGKSRQAFLAALKWWRDDFPKLGKEDRERLTANHTISAQELERIRKAANTQAIYLMMLQQAFDARQLEILALSNIRAKGHETNMLIINNIRPSGRYEYNPSTGRYDRYVPYR